MPCLMFELCCLSNAHLCNKSVSSCSCFSQHTSLRLASAWACRASPLHLQRMYLARIRV